MTRLTFELDSSGTVSGRRFTDLVILTSTELCPFIPDLKTLSLLQCCLKNWKDKTAHSVQYLDMKSYFKRFKVGIIVEYMDDMLRSCFC